MANNLVELDVDDGVARVTLDRPDARNAISASMAGDLVDTFERIEESNARCVVVAGAGDAFCAGGDVRAMLEAQEDQLGYEDRVSLVEQSVSRAVETVYECRLPTIAKLDGAAYGAGAGVLLACDVQLASPDGQIGFGFRRVGLATDSGVSYLLPKYVGINTAKELVFTGELLDADRARELGLVTRLFERDSFEEGVASIVETVASGPTAALAGSKDLLNRSHGSLSEATRDEARTQAVLLDTRDHAEGARAFVDQREPSFEGR